MRAVRVDGWETWRDAARALLAEGAQPERVRWVDPTGDPGLFDGGAAALAAPASAPAVPRRLVELLREAVAWVGPDRFDLAYRLLWRVVTGERALLDDPIDPDVAEVRRRAAAVRHDVHRMHAFVRFRPVGDRMVAWYRPDHDVLDLAVPHFVDRFGGTRWAILTPRGSAVYDGELRRGLGVAEHDRTAPDEVEALWLAYYAAVFEPSRASAARLAHHLPLRFRAQLDEGRVIPALFESAAGRVAAAAATQRPTEAFLPADRSLTGLREAAAGCRACGLCEHATRTVFGEGDPRARLVLVGEQPGDAEDLEGRPFVGPAGQVLARAMAAAGLSREQVWLTNAVKHFKFTLGPERSRRGLKIDKPRLHRRPDPPEVEACRPWLLAELAAIRPTLVLALGATAASSLVGRKVRVGEARGERFRLRVGDVALPVRVTFHPSAVLRGDDPAVFRALCDDLAAARSAAGLCFDDGSAPRARRAGER